MSPGPQQDSLTPLIIRLPLHFDFPSQSSSPSLRKPLQSVGVISSSSSSPRYVFLPPSISKELLPFASTLQLLSHLPSLLSIFDPCIFISDCVNSPPSLSSPSLCVSPPLLPPSASMPLLLLLHLPLPFHPSPSSPAHHRLLSSLPSSRSNCEIGLRPHLCLGISVEDLLSFPC